MGQPKKRAFILYAIILVGALALIYYALTLGQVPDITQAELVESVAYGNLLPSNAYLAITPKQDTYRVQDECYSFVLANTAKIGYEYHYALEVFLCGIWYTIPAREGVAFPAAMFTIPAQSEVDMDIYLESYNKLTPGQYRVWVSLISRFNEPGFQPAHVVPDLALEFQVE